MFIIIFLNRISCTKSVVQNQWYRISCTESVVQNQLGTESVLQNQLRTESVERRALFERIYSASLLIRPNYIVWSILQQTCLNHRGDLLRRLPTMRHVVIFCTSTDFNYYCPRTTKISLVLWIYIYIYIYIYIIFVIYNQTYTDIVRYWNLKVN